MQGLWPGSPRVLTVQNSLESLGAVTCVTLPNWEKNRHLEGLLESGVNRLAFFDNYNSYNP
jgi:hypothetical protein